MSYQGWIGAALTAALLGCTPGLPSPGGGAVATAPAPHRPWTPPASALRDTTLPRTAVPADLESRVHSLALTDVVDLALRNSPLTRQAWANARAAAASYGAVRGQYFPTIDVGANVTRVKSTVAQQGRQATNQWVYGPNAILSWLVLDFGGRGGRTENARQALLQADFSHNATINDVVLQTQSAYFNYVAQIGLLEAQRTTLEEARANLTAADERRRVGVATIADVLQARTAASQAELALEQTEGARQTARGALALALGLPANVPYDVDSTAGQVDVHALADSVDKLIAAALRGRPDLSAARAAALAEAATVRDARGARLPSISMSGSAGRSYIHPLGSPNPPSNGNNYTLSVGLAIPVFSGFSREYTEAAARARADAARARFDQLGQQVTYQVFTAYYTLQTATRRTRTADDLLASATQSVDAARARYRQGVGTVLDLLSAQAALASARAQRIQARLDWQVALAQLAHDAGLLDEQGHTTIRLQPDSAGAGAPR